MSCHCICHRAGIDMEKVFCEKYCSFSLRKEHFKNAQKVARAVDLLELEKRVRRIEKWIDIWENFDAGWNKNNLK